MLRSPRSGRDRQALAAVDARGDEIHDEGRDGRAGRSVAASFGVVVDRSGTVTPPVRLLAPPDVSAWPALQERVLVRFPIRPQPAVVAYRAQVAAVRAGIAHALRYTS